VPPQDELARARGRERDAILVRLDLFRDADLHGASPYRFGSKRHLRIAEVEKKADEGLGVFDFA
jgi:hypothetical protein